MSGNNHLIVDEGDTITLTFTFRDNSGALVTPGTTTFAQRTPTQTETGGTTTTTGWTTVSTGVQSRTVTLSTPGLWQFEARGSGLNSDSGVQTVTIDVRRSNVRV